MCKSDCSPIWFRPRHEKIVRERLPMGSAFYGERLCPFVLGDAGNCCGFGYFSLGFFGNSS